MKFETHIHTYIMNFGTYIHASISFRSYIKICKHELRTYKQTYIYIYIMKFETYIHTYIHMIMNFGTYTCASMNFEHINTHIYEHERSIIQTYRLRV